MNSIIENFKHNNIIDINEGYFLSAIYHLQSSNKYVFPIKGEKSRTIPKDSYIAIDYCSKNEINISWGQRFENQDKGIQGNFDITEDEFLDFIFDIKMIGYKKEEKNKESSHKYNNQIKNVGAITSLCSLK